MIKKIFAYTIAAIAFIDIVYFSYYSYYNGDLIHYKALWIFAGIIVLLVSLYIALTSKTGKEQAAAAEDLNRRNKLIATGEQIKLDIDSCDIRENNYYYEEITNQVISELQKIDAELDPNENYREKYVDESAIIYHHTIGDKTEKYISQTFPFGPEALTVHILNNDIILYVDRFDRSNYLFDLKVNE